MSVSVITSLSVRVGPASSCRGIVGDGVRCQASDRVIKKREEEEEESDTSLFILNAPAFVPLLRHKTLCDRLI